MTEEEMMILDEHRRKIRERLKLPNNVFIPGWENVQGFMPEIPKPESSE